MTKKMAKITLKQLFLKFNFSWNRDIMSNPSLVLPYLENPIF
jgi:hypothetical protein